jgi:hypothetical protein
MKTILSLLLFSFAVITASSQPPHHPPPISERWKHDSLRLVRLVSLQPSQILKVRTLFLQFHTSMDQLKEKNKGARPAREEVEKVAAIRNEKLKAILTSQQYQKFEAAQKEFLPPPPGERRGKPGPPPSSLK